MSDITLKQIRSGYNLSKINQNFEDIEESINNDVIHSNGGGNVMGQELDMNSNKLTNVPTPEDGVDAANKNYVDSRLVSVTGGGVSQDIDFRIWGDRFVGTFKKGFTYTKDFEVARANDGSYYTYIGDDSNYPVTVAANTNPEDFPLLYGKADAEDSSSVIYKAPGLNTVTRSIYSRFEELGVSVRDFGAVCDGVTDDTAAVQKAFDFALSNKVYFPDNSTCVLASTVNITPKTGLVIDFGTCIIKYTSTVNNTGAFLMENNYTDTTLSASISRGDGSFLVSDATGIGKNQIVSVFNDSVWFSNALRSNKKGESFIVDTVIGNEVVIWGGGSIFSYSTPATVRVYDLVENVSIRGGTFIGEGAEFKTYIFSCYGINNLSFHGHSISDVNSGVGFSSCTNVYVSNCYFREIDLAGLGYSVTIGTFNRTVTVSDCRGYRGRHFVTTVGEDGISSDILICDNNFQGSIQRAIDTHVNGYNVRIVDNLISDSYGGIQVRSPLSTISGNKIVNCTDPDNANLTTSKSNVAAILALEYGHVNLTIHDNEIINDHRFSNLFGRKGNKQSMFGTAIDVRAEENLAAYDEFDNKYISIKGGSIRGFTNGSAISVNCNDANNNKPDKITVMNVSTDDFGFVGINIVGGVSSDRSVDVSLFDNDLGSSTRANYNHISVTNSRTVIIRGNQQGTAAQPNVYVENALRALVDNKKPITVVTAAHSHIPEMVNVDNGLYFGWGVAFATTDIDIHSDVVHTIKLQSVDGSSAAEYRLSNNMGVVTVFETGAVTPTVTVLSGVITVNMAGTFIWKLEPSVELLEV